MDALSSGGLHQAGKDAMGFQSAFRPSSEAYLAEDDQMSERLFRVIVREGYAGAPEEGEEEFLLGSCEIGPEGLGVKSGALVQRQLINADDSVLIIFRIAIHLFFGRSDFYSSFS
jgi:hypothetical protein